VEVDRAHRRRDDIDVAYPATLLLLAGGQSRRMGRPKALLPIGGGTFFEWVAGRLRGGFPELLVAASRPVQLPSSLRSRFLPDRLPGAGPLAGIEAGLRAARHSTVVVVACDMPDVSPDLAERLAAAAEGRDAAVPRVGRRPEPACAAYRRSALDAITEALDGGDLKAANVLARLDVSWLDDVDPALLSSLNTPADYRAFLARISKTR
jgi:molybdopterin-guanine dinucleotide biosynthesis protein A